MAEERRCKMQHHFSDHSIGFLKASNPKRHNATGEGTICLLWGGRILEKDCPRLKHKKNNKKTGASVLLGNQWPKPHALVGHDDNNLHKLSHNRRFQSGTQCCPPKTNMGKILEGPKGGRRCYSTISSRCPRIFRPWVRPNMGRARWSARDSPET